MELGVDLKLRGTTANTAATATTAASPSPTSVGSFSNAMTKALSGGETGYDNYFEAAAAAFDLPVNLLKAVGKAESGYRANAVSSCGAQGIMQLMPSTARSMGVTDAFDPAQNIMGGAKCLRQLLDQFNGNVSYALAAYNAGPGAVKKYDGIPPYKETQNYVKKVLGYAGSDAVSAVSAAKTAKTASTAAVSALSTAAAQTVSGVSASAFEGTELLSQLIDTALESYGEVNQDAIRLYLERLCMPDTDEDEDDPLYPRI